MTTQNDRRLLPDIDMGDEMKRRRIQGEWVYENNMTGKPFDCRVTDPRTKEQWDEEAKNDHAN